MNEEIKTSGLQKWSGNDGNLLVFEAALNSTI